MGGEMSAIPAHAALAWLELAIVLPAALAVAWAIVRPVRRAGPRAPDLIRPHRDPLPAPAAPEETP